MEVVITNDANAAAALAADAIERVLATVERPVLGLATGSSPIATYRERFKPSERLREPYVMLGFNVCAAETQEEATFLRSSSLQAFINLRSGTPGQLPPPVEDFESRMSPQEQAMLAQIGRCSSAGTPETVTLEIANFITMSSHSTPADCGYDSDAEPCSHPLFR